MDLVNHLSGGRSAFAFYNLSRLTFVYLTEMPQSRFDSTDLWRGRSNYQARAAAGIPFYVKSGEGGRSVAFASYKDWFVVSSDEDRMAATLVLLSGQKAASIGTETWFSSAAQQAQTQGNLRLVYNLEALLATPQFRTYWIQRNASELRPFSSGISDLFENSDGFEEQRFLLRKTSAPAPMDDSSLKQVLRYAPAQSSLYRAWSSPDTALLSGILQQVVFGDSAAPAIYSQMAPAVTPEAGAIGNASDLEVRIDEPSIQHASQQSITPFVDALLKMEPTAVLHVQSTSVLRDQVFVMPDSGIVLICKHPDAALLNQVLSQVASITETGSLDPLQVSVSENVIVLTRMDLPPSSAALTLPADVTFAAGYNHATEWPHYTKLFALIERNASNRESPVYAGTPPFFSRNVQSLGNALSRLQRASILTSDKGVLLQETVRYEMARQ